MQRMSATEFDRFLHRQHFDCILYHTKTQAKYDRFSGEPVFTLLCTEFKAAAAAPYDIVMLYGKDGTIQFNHVKRIEYSMKNETGYCSAVIICCAGFHNEEVRHKILIA